LFVGLDKALILILGYLLMTYTVLNDFYVTFMSSGSDPFYDNLNKTSEFLMKLSPTIKFKEGN